MLTFSYFSGVLGDYMAPTLVLRLLLIALVACGGFTCPSSLSSLAVMTQRI